MDSLEKKTSYANFAERQEMRATNIIVTTMSEESFYPNWNISGF